MEKIRKYLATMFRNMPDTPEVRRAKDELGQMMEDKYASLLEEGIPENEAISHVLAEFGNLDDLSEVLDIQRYLPARIENEKRSGWELGLEEVRSCIRDDRFAVVLLAFGVFLCIVSVSMPVLFSGAGDMLGTSSLDGLGAALFLIIAVAGVWSIVYSRTPGKKWKFIKKESCSIDLTSSFYLDKAVKTQAPQLGHIRSVGIALCVLSVVPVMVFTSIVTYGGLHSLLSSIGVTLLFIMIGAGVMLIIFASLYNRAAKRLLKLNGGPQDMPGDAGPARARQQRQVRWRVKHPMLFWMMGLATVAAVSLVVRLFTNPYGPEESVEYFPAEPVRAEVTEETAVGLSDDFSSISIDVNAGSVEISSGEIFSFSGANTTNVECRTQDGVLHVTSFDTSNYLNPPQIRITLPYDYLYENVEIDVDQGDVSISDLSAGSIRVACMAGDISVMGGFFLTAYMNENNGNVSLDGLVFDDMDIDCAQGNIDIILPGESEEYNMELTSATGLITVGDKFSSESGGMYTQRAEGNNLRVNCETGNIAVH